MEVAQNSAVGKATLILEAIVSNSQPANIADLASKLAMPRQTVHRVLGQLSELGLVRRDVARERFFVGPRLRAMSLSVLALSPTDAMANLVLRNLVDEVHETCNVGMLDGDKVVYLNRVECDWPLRVQLRPGSRVPAYCTAIGKLLLAYMPEQEQKVLIDSFRFRRLTPNTLTNPAELRESLLEIAQRGYSINNQEDSLGLVAVAVPITDADGRVVAGLAVHAAEARMPVDQIVRRLPLMRRTAAKLSQVFWNSNEEVNK